MKITADSFISKMLDKSESDSEKKASTPEKNGYHVQTHASGL